MKSRNSPDPSWIHPRRRRPGPARSVLAACGDDCDSASSDSGTDSRRRRRPPADVVRLGYFPNVTHAPALVGVAEGTFTEGARRAPRSRPRPSTPVPRPSRRCFAERLDITYIGPNPAINAYAKSDGEAIRIVGGSTSGGAYFVVKPEINRPRTSRARPSPSPQLGNTQDVALRTWLKDEGLNTDTSGGGDVSIKPAGERRHPQRVQDRRHRRRLGARAVGHAPRPGGRRQGPRRRGRRCGPRASTSPPTSSSARSSSTSTPGP